MVGRLARDLGNRPSETRRLDAQRESDSSTDGLRRSVPPHMIYAHLRRLPRAFGRGRRWGATCEPIDREEGFHSPVASGLERGCLHSPATCCPSAFAFVDTAI